MRVVVLNGGLRVKKALWPPCGGNVERVAVEFRSYPHSSQGTALSGASNPVVQATQMRVAPAPVRGSVSFQAKATYSSHLLHDQS
jgi:hypothetical protein